MKLTEHARTATAPTAYHIRLVFAYPGREGGGARYRAQALLAEVSAMSFAHALRRFTFTTHVTSSVGWIGAVLVFLALAGIGVTSQDERTVRGAYLMAPAAWFVLVPLAHAALLSGIALSLGTPWGLIRHYWVALKLVVTAFSTVILMIYMGTFRQMAGVAADPVVELGRYGTLAAAARHCRAHLAARGNRARDL